MVRRQVDGCTRGRKVEFRRDDEALRLLEAERENWLEGELRLARLFARAYDGDAVLGASCGSIPELARRLGYHAGHARHLLQLGLALDALPLLEARLRAGSVDFETACEMGRIFLVPELIEPDDDWLADAGTLRMGEIRYKIQRRIETLRQGSPAQRRLVVLLGADAWLDLHDAWAVASSRNGRKVTRGQLVSAALKHFLFTFSPDYQGTRKRRMPPTEEIPAGRGVPAEVKRAVWKRSGGLCEVGVCEEPIQNLCHLHPHRSGSGREERDLFGGCWTHHKLYDDPESDLAFRAWSKEGTPIFWLPTQERVLEPKPPPCRDGRPALPDWLCRILGRRPDGSSLRKGRAASRPGRRAGARPPGAGPAGPRDAGGRSSSGPEDHGAGRVGERRPPAYGRVAPPRREASLRRPRPHLRI